MQEAATALVCTLLPAIEPVTLVRAQRMGAQLAADHLAQRIGMFSACMPRNAGC